jgi:hypothetical protein
MKQFIKPTEKKQKKGYLWFKTFQWSLLWVELSSSSPSKVCAELDELTLLDLMIFSALLFIPSCLVFIIWSYS